jgi:hypothetical protein
MPRSASSPTSPSGWAIYDDRARVLSQIAPGAMLWASAWGALPGTELDSPVYRLAALRAVGLQGATPDEGFCRESACEAAGTRLSPVHRRLCPYFRTSRHNELVRLLETFLHEVYAGLVRRECGGAAFHARVGASGQIRDVGRGDLVVHHTGLSTGVPLLDRMHWIIDVSVGDPAASGVRDHSWHLPGVTAAGLAASKHVHYKTPGVHQSLLRACRTLVAALPPPPAHLAPAGSAAAVATAAYHAHVSTASEARWAPAECVYAHATHVLLPFAVETHGRLGPAASRLLKALAVHGSGGPGAGGDVAARGRLLGRWRLLLSCTLARAVSVQASTHPGPVVSPLGVAAASRRSSSSASRAPLLASGPSLGGASALPGSPAAASLAVAPGGFSGGLAAP